MIKRRNFSPEFKARVALDAFRGDLMIQEIASKHKLHPNQVSTWKRQAMDGLGDIFTGGSERTRQDHDDEVHDLHAKIGQLTVERDFLPKGSNDEQG
jgi:transposase-like protein